MGYRREICGVAAAGLVLGLLITAPVWVASDARIMGSADSENYSGAWVISWAQQQMLSTGLPPHRAVALNFPQGRAIHCLPLMDALLTLPLRPLLSASAIYNLLVAFHLALAFCCSWLFLRAHFRSRWAVLPGSLAFATTPFLLSSLSTGPLEVFCIGWIPLCLWAVPRAILTGGRRRVLLAGLLLGCVFLANPYYFVFSVVGIAALTLADAGWQLLRRPLLMRAVSIGLVAFALMLPQVWALSRSLGVTARVMDPFMARDLLDRVYAQDLLSFLLPLDRFYHYSPPIRVYLGLALLLLALTGVRRVGWRRWALLAGVAGVFSLGTFLEVGGWRPSVGEYELPLPAYFLCHFIPPFTSILHPFRAVPVVVLALGMLVALGLDHLSPRLLRPAALAAAGLILVDQLLLAPMTFPPATSSARIPRFYQELARQPGNHAVLDMFSAVEPLSFGPSMIFQAVHQRPLLYDIFPPGRKMMENKLVQVVGWDPRAGQQMVQGRLCEDARALGQLGVRFVVKHLRATEPTDPRVTALKACKLPLVWQDKEVLVFRLDAEK